MAFTLRRDLGQLLRNLSGARTVHVAVYVVMFARATINVTESRSHAARYELLVSFPCILGAPLVLKRGFAAVMASRALQDLPSTNQSVAIRKKLRAFKQGLRKTVEAIMDQSDRHESKFKKQNLKRLQTSREMLGKRIAARRVLRDSRQLIKKTEIFKHLSDESIKKVIDAMKYQTFRDQTHLVTQGKVGNELMVIMHGTAIVVRHGKTISKVGSLDVIGEPALVNDDHIRTATVQATS